MRIAQKITGQVRTVLYALLIGAIFAAINAFGICVARQLNADVPAVNFLKIFTYFLLGAGAFAFLVWGSKAKQLPKVAPLQRRRLNVCTFVLLTCSWIVPFAHFWPAVAMNDTWAIYEGPVRVSNQHPLGYGLYLTGLSSAGTAIFGSEARGLAFATAVQILLWAAGVVFVVDTLNVLRVKPAFICAFVAYAAFFPVVADYAIALVKDSPFILALVLLSVLLVCVWVRKGVDFRRPGFALVYIAVLIGLAATRNNGKILALVAVVLVGIWASKSRTIAVVAGVSALVIGAIPGVWSSYYVGPHKYVESVGVPLQMIGYTLKVNRQCLPQQDLDYYSKIFPLDLWAQFYDPVTIDRVKYNPHFQWDYMQTTKDEFPKHFVSSALSCPRSFARGYMNHTYPYWTASAKNVGQTTQSTFTALVSNETDFEHGYTAMLRGRGVVNHSQLPQKLDKAVCATWIPLLMKTKGTGSWVWAALLIGLAAIVNRKRAVLVCLLPSAVIMATLLVASPHTLVFRYSAFLTITVPLALIILFSSGGKRMGTC